MARGALRLATALALCLAAGGAAWARPALAQISPGPLAAAHGKLEGTLRCNACHGGGGESAMTAACLDCHKEVAWLRARRLGLHSREGRDRCASCHPDHAGSDFRLVTWDEGDSTRFDHRRAGWPLDGSHVEVPCTDCHRPELRRSPAAALVQRSSPERGWVGLDRSCATCHDDAHRGELAANCLECHDTRDWKPAPKFDHDTTAYPLSGKHISTECDACHSSPRVVVRRTAGGDPVPVYRPLRFQKCSDCHRDPHRGALGARCEDCHETGGFTKIAKGAFDHDRTRYPLRGRHAAVACEGCHDFATANGKRPAFAACGACHADAHAGGATLSGRTVDCASCHDVAGFRPATFTLAQHRASRYPLEGRHQQVACAACHPKTTARTAGARLGTAGTLMRPAFARCGGCHGDDHGTQLAGGTDCRECHDLAGWSPSTFGRTRHAATRLALDDRHAEIACSACHGPRRPGLPALSRHAGLGKAGLILRPEERECASCHVDVHAGRFAAAGASPGSRSCPACHDARRFRPSTMDATAHDELGFRLEGAHRAVPCAECHESLRRPALSATLVGTAPRDTRLDLTRSSTCTECHTDPHDGQFTQRGSAASCENCHGVERFRPADRWDHDRDTGFPLTGAHERVTCLACHAARRTVGGRSVVVYAPL